MWRMASPYACSTLPAYFSASRQVSLGRPSVDAALIGHIFHFCYLAQFFDKCFHISRGHHRVLSAMDGIELYRAVGNGIGSKEGYRMFCVQVAWSKLLNRCSEEQALP